jgi:hypothetical protein
MLRLKDQILICKGELNMFPLLKIKEKNTLNEKELKEINKAIEYIKDEISNILDSEDFNN